MGSGPSLSIVRKFRAVSLYTLAHGRRTLANARKGVLVPESVVRLPRGPGGGAWRDTAGVRRPGERRVRCRGTGHGRGRRGARTPVEAAARRLHAGAAERRGRCRRGARAGGP